MASYKLKLRCTNDFRVFNPMGNMMRGMELIGWFEEGEEYEATLDLSKRKYFVVSSIGKKAYPAFIDRDGELIVEEGWELIDRFSDNKMPTWKAIKLLTEGKKVRRASWEEKNDYIYLDEKGSLRHSSGNRYRLEHHISRDDWEEYVEGVK